MEHNSISNNVGTKGQWYTGEFQYEGFPLLLRFRGNLTFDILKNKYPRLLKIEHALAKVQPSGFPEADYNDSLSDFDQELVAAFDEGNFGLVVIIETFSGRRNYYFYVSEKADVEKVKHQISLKYAQHELTWKMMDDPDWTFIRGYSKEFNLP